MSITKSAPGRLLVLALGTFASSTALAAWGEATVPVWTARNAALVAAVNQPIGAGAPQTADGKPALHVVNSRGLFYKPSDEESAATGASAAWVKNIEDKCDGLLGEQIKTGGRNSPNWAQMAQSRFCGGAKATGNALMDKSHDKQRCKDLASAISYLQKAKAGDDPEAVVQSAAELMAAAEKLRAMPIVMTQKGKILGDGQRTFTCD